MERKDCRVNLNTIRVRPEVDLNTSLEKRVARCTDEINRVLDKYGFTLEVLTDISLTPKEDIE